MARQSSAPRKIPGKASTDVYKRQVQPQPPVTSFPAPIQEKKEATVSPQAAETAPFSSETVQTCPQPSPVTNSSVVPEPIPSGQTVQVTPVSSNPPVMSPASPQETIPQNISGTVPYQQPSPPIQGVPVGSQLPVGYPVDVYKRQEKSRPK